MASLTVKKYSKETIWKFCYELLRWLKVPEEHAEIFSNATLDADLKGIHSHGVNMVPSYANAIQRGAIKGDAKPRKIKDTAVLCLMDACGGLGQVAATCAMDEAVQKASKVGIGVAAVNNANHFGAAGYYAQMAARKNMIGLVICNTPAFVPPWGGAESLFGTNPICIALPGGDKKPILVDMATSEAAMSKVLLAKRRGEKLPEGWVVDEEGMPTTDPDKVFTGTIPRAVFKGSLLPMSGPKGYGLTLAIDTICALICSAKFSNDIKPLYGGTLEPSGMGYFLAALDIAHFTELEHYNKEISARVDQIKDSRKAKGTEEIFLPGEIEQNKAKLYEREGIPLEAGVISQLNVLAENLGFKGRL